MTDMKMTDMKIKIRFLLVMTVIAVMVAGPAAAQMGTSYVPYRLQGFTGLDAKGLPALIVFYTTTCPYCVDFFKTYLPLEKELASKMSVHLVALDKDPEAVKKHAEEMKFKVPVLLDPDARIAKAYGGQTTPHIVLVDSSGYIQYALGGTLDGALLKDMVMKVAAHPAGDAFKPLFHNHAPAVGGG